MQEAFTTGYKEDARPYFTGDFVFMPEDEVTRYGFDGKHPQ